MAPDTLCVLITPSAAGSAWRATLIQRAGQLGWPVSDLEASGALVAPVGLVFTSDHAAMRAVAPAARVVVIDTTATDETDPGQPASPEGVIARAHALVEAEKAVQEGALQLNAARYILEFPDMGALERPEGAPYRIHPSVTESPLALFDDPEPGASANWHPRWFAYPEGHTGTSDLPLFDLTGRMRPLVAGPYIRLPAGRWRIDLGFTVDPERGQAPLLFEWGSGSEFSRVASEIRYPGAYTVSLDRIWPEADSAQLRIWPGHPVFQGILGFQGARVTRIALDDPSPPTPTDRIVEAAVV